MALIEKGRDKVFLGRKKRQREGDNLPFIARRTHKFIEIRRDKVRQIKEDSRMAFLDRKKRQIEMKKRHSEAD